MKRFGPLVKYIYGKHPEQMALSPKWTFADKMNKRYVLILNLPFRVGTLKAYFVKFRFRAINKNYEKRM